MNKKDKQWIPVTCEELTQPCLCRGFLTGSGGKGSDCNARDSGLIPESGRSLGEEIGCSLQHSSTLLVAQLVRNLSAMQETWVQALGWEDHLEKGKATYTPVFWPGKFNGLYPKDLDTTVTFSFSCLCKGDFRAFPLRQEQAKDAYHNSV